MLVCPGPLTDLGAERPGLSKYLRAAHSARGILGVHCQQDPRSPGIIKQLLSRCVDCNTGCQEGVGDDTNERASLIPVAPSLGWGTWALVVLGNAVRQHLSDTCHS